MRSRPIKIKAHTRIARHLHKFEFDSSSLNSNLNCMLDVVLCAFDYLLFNSHTHSSFPLNRTHNFSFLFRSILRSSSSPSHYLDLLSFSFLSICLFRFFHSFLVFLTIASNSCCITIESIHWYVRICRKIQYNTTLWFSSQLQNTRYKLKPKFCNVWRSIRTLLSSKCLKYCLLRACTLRQHTQTHTHTGTHWTFYRQIQTRRRTQC